MEAPQTSVARSSHEQANATRTSEATQRNGIAGQDRYRNERNSRDPPLDNRDTKIRRCNVYRTNATPRRTRDYTTMTNKTTDMYIAISGNIGSGKTSLTDLLTERLGATALYEETGNPYIADFYEDMKRWSFNFQIYFLGCRMKQGMTIRNTPGYIIQDRTIYEDALIFAANLHEMGLMSSRDFDTYMKIFELSGNLIPTPDLLIYLRASVPTLVSQILKRGRCYEMGIDIDYLERLNNKYNDWIDNRYAGRVLTIDIDNEDFILNPSIVDEIVDKIKGLEISAEKR